MGEQIKMGIKYIRDTYHVPAKRGMRVEAKREAGG